MEGEGKVRKGNGPKTEVWLCHGHRDIFKTCMQQALGVEWPTINFGFR